MLAYTYVEKGKFALLEKPKPALIAPTDALVRVTMSSICTSDLHIKHGSVPRAVPGITVGHEMVGFVEAVGSEVTKVRPGDRVTVNVETFCGSCFFCKNGYVNNCTDPNGGWALGCRIDGGQAEYVRVPLADQGLNRIPDAVSDEQALFVGDVLATGFWAARISEITPNDTVLIIGAGPTGICTLLCVMLRKPKRIIVCEKSEERRQFVQTHYPDVLLTTPEDCKTFVLENSDHGGADRVLEVAGGNDTFRLAWECARPNAIVTVVALYDRPQTLPLPEMYGKNLTFKTGGVDGCDCEEVLRLIEQGKIDTTPLITHRFPLSEIEEAYRIFENKLDGVIKVAVTSGYEIPHEHCFLERFWEHQNIFKFSPELVKTEIVPTVLVIHPSGYTEFVEADVNPMSFREMGALINAESLDTVHRSEAMAQITRTCQLEKDLVMYVDGNAQMNGLKDNPVATQLYGYGPEIRGAVILALEDHRYDTYSFEIEEEIEAVFDAIDDMTGLLRRETDDDGRYDAWA